MSDERMERLAAFQDEMRKSEQLEAALEQVTVANARLQDALLQFVGVLCDSHIADEGPVGDAARAATRVAADLLRALQAVDMEVLAEIDPEAATMIQQQRESAAKALKTAENSHAQ